MYYEREINCGKGKFIAYKAVERLLNNIEAEELGTSRPDFGSNIPFLAWLLVK